MTEQQKKYMLELLWDSLKKAAHGSTDRRVTGWGIKTQEGLIESIERILEPTKGGTNG